MGWLFIGLPLIILLTVGVASVVVLLIDARDTIDRILDDEVEPSNVVEFPTRNGDSDGVA